MDDIDAAKLRERIAVVRQELEAAADDLDALLPHVKRRGQAQLRVQQAHLRRLASHLVLEERADEPDEDLSHDLMRHGKRAIAILVVAVGSLVGSFLGGAAQGVGQAVWNQLHERDRIVANACAEASSTPDYLYYQGMIADLQSLLKGQREAAPDEEDILWSEITRFADDRGRPLPSSRGRSELLAWLEHERLWLVAASRDAPPNEPQSDLADG